MTLTSKVLIVDDQPEVRELLTVTLEGNDYQIFTAENGQQALALAHAELPDIIFLDIMMPGVNLNGLEVCRRLKSNPATAKSYVILLSVKSQQHDIEAGRCAGADDYFIKPFSPMVLRQKVTELMEQNGKRAKTKSKKPVTNYLLRK